MAIKNIIAMGIGFAPGSIKYMPTLGFSIGSGVDGLAPWCLAGADMYTAGAVKATSYISGEAMSEHYTAGPVATKAGC